MKMIFKLLSGCLVGLIAGYVFIWLTDVPQVFVVSNSLKDPKNPDTWNIKQIKNTEGKVVPQSLWDEVLKGRYEVIPVAASWEPSDK